MFTLSREKAGCLSHSRFQCGASINIEAVLDLDLFGSALVTRRLDRCDVVLHCSASLSVSWVMKTDAERYLSHHSLFDARATSDRCISIGKLVWEWDADSTRI